MPRKATPLTDSAIKVAKPKDSPYKLTDGQGLYLEVTPNGSKLWRLKYRFDGKEKRLALAYGFRDSEYFFLKIKAAFPGKAR
ncbi:DUF4102 domain-containing protein [Pseudomonas sp. LM13]